MQGYIEFTYDTEPNFLGEEMTLEEYRLADFSEDMTEKGLGEMKL